MVDALLPCQGYSQGDGTCEERVRERKDEYSRIQSSCVGRHGAVTFVLSLSTSVNELSFVAQKLGFSAALPLYTDCIHRKEGPVLGYLLPGISMYQVAVYLVTVVGHLVHTCIKNQREGHSYRGERDLVGVSTRYQVPGTANLIQQLVASLL